MFGECAIVVRGWRDSVWFLDSVWMMGYCLEGCLEGARCADAIGFLFGHNLDGRLMPIGVCKVIGWWLYNVHLRYPLKNVQV